VVVFYTSANDPHVGPAREWVELSRSIAEAECASTALGRAAWANRTSKSEQWLPIYSQTDVRDAIDVARHARRTAESAGGRPCSGSGICRQARASVPARILVNRGYGLGQSAPLICGSETSRSRY